MHLCSVKNDKHTWSIHLRARIPASHAGHRGSNPLSTTKKEAENSFFFRIYSCRSFVCGNVSLYSILLRCFSIFSSLCTWGKTKGQLQAKSTFVPRIGLELRSSRADAILAQTIGRAINPNLIRATYTP